MTRARPPPPPGSGLESVVPTAADADFRSATFWDAFFAARGDAPFEWYGDWRQARVKTGEEGRVGGLGRWAGEGGPCAGPRGRRARPPTLPPHPFQLRPLVLPLCARPAGSPPARVLVLGCGNSQLSAQMRGIVGSKWLGKGGEGAATAAAALPPPAAPPPIPDRPLSPRCPPSLSKV